MELDGEIRITKISRKGKLAQFDFYLVAATG
jgi:hypothetical protein